MCSLAHESSLVRIQSTYCNKVACKFKIKFQYNGNCISFDFGASEQYKENVTKLLIFNIHKESYMHFLVHDPRRSQDSQIF